jgi:hypothetical protein
MNAVSKQLNYTLSDGLLVTTVRLKKGTPLAICYVTDLTDTARVVLDMEGKKVVSTQIQVKESDLEGLIAAIQKL